MKKTIYDSMGLPMTINFPDRIQSTPNSEPVELPIFKCPACNLPMIPDHATFGGKGYQQVCLNPECVNNMSSEAYAKWLENKSKKKSMEKGIELRDGAWKILDGGL